jgi:RNA polymerase sigma-70 factor, ECF subfamily
MSTTEFHRRADALQRGCGTTARFRRRTPLWDTSEDAAIVARAAERARDGDREALRYLYIRYAERVFSYVVTIVHDEHEAEDVTQHVFAKLMVALPAYDRRRAPFASWILRISRNLALDHMRKLRAIPCEEVRANACDESVAEDGRQRNILLRQGLESLPEDQRQVIVLRHVVGLSPSEIALRLGRTESSINGLHNRGRGALRSVLAATGATPAIHAAQAA